MLVNCGHSLCDACLKAIKNSERYTCPQCRKVSDKATTNYTVKAALEALRQQSAGGKNNEFFVTSCVHEASSDENFEKCDHCKREFCSPCLTSHKVFLRMESGIINSQV